MPEILIGETKLKNVEFVTTSTDDKSSKHPKGHVEKGWVLVGDEDMFYDYFKMRKKTDDILKLIKKKPRKKKTSGEVTKLKATNYDNYKNAEFFIKQYFLAQDMLDEVQKFFDSFMMSKLMTIDQIKGLKVTNIDFGDWIEHVDSSKFNGRQRSIMSSCEVTEYGKPVKHFFNPVMYKEKVESFLKDEICKNSKLWSTKYGCYWVIDKDGTLYDFVPIASKDSIKIDFSSGAIVISGKYYSYYEYGGQWGKCKFNKEEITVKIVINPDNNNVEGVVRKTKIIGSGEVAGKTYWDHYSSYCQPCLVGDNSYNTKW